MRVCMYVVFISVTSLYHRDKLKETQEELAKCQDEIAKLNESVKSKSVVVQKLQKVGRSYRMKFEETSKELEELKESAQVVTLCAMQVS